MDANKDGIERAREKGLTLGESQLDTTHLFFGHAKLESERFANTEHGHYEAPGERLKLFIRVYSRPFAV
jgi:hypothetical protein